MKKELIYLILCIAIAASSCRVLTPGQVKNINAFSTSTKAYTQFPSQIVRKRTELVVEEKLVGTIGQIADRLKTSIGDIQQAEIDQQKIADKLDLSLQLIQQYAGLLNKLSADTYVEDLEKNVSALNENLTGLIETTNSQLTNKIPASASKAVTEAIFLVGKRLTKSKQTKALKKFVPQGDSIIQVTVKNIVSALSETMNPLLASDKEKFVTTYTNSVLRDKPGIDYPILTQYYVGLKNYDNLAKLNEQCIKSAQKLAIAHGVLTSNISSKKNIKDIFKETQELITSVKDLYKTFHSLSSNSKS